MTDLTAFGTIPDTYRHHDRRVIPAEPLVLPGAILKWYYLAPQDESVPPDLDEAARQQITTEASGGHIVPDYGLGFAILHASHPLAYLIVGVWRANQELWQTLYIADREAGTSFVKADPGVTAPTLCVWELAPVWHERQAWIRYLRSARDEAAKRDYLADHLTGLV